MITDGGVAAMDSVVASADDAEDGAFDTTVAFEMDGWVMTCCCVIDWYSWTIDGSERGRMLGYRN